MPSIETRNTATLAIQNTGHGEVSACGRSTEAERVHELLLARLPGLRRAAGPQQERTECSPEQSQLEHEPLECFAQPDFSRRTRRCRCFTHGAVQRLVNA